MYNYSKLYGAMRESGYTQDEVASKIGIDAATFNKKLRNNSQFKQAEIQAIMILLHLPMDSVQEYFFAH